FNRLDTNKDNRLNRYELEGTVADQWNSAFMNTPFQNIDRNRDGWVERTEWQWNDATFYRTDTNNDGRVSRFEFETAAGQGVTAPAQNTTRSAAYQAGFDRGTDEGRMAGREDRVRNQGFDLEGQTELERADSGYYAQIGSLSDYQSGYREGFRQA